MSGRRCPYCGNTETPSRAPSLAVCCDDCYDSLPRDIPGYPKVRSVVRWAYSGSGSDSSHVTFPKRQMAVQVKAAITAFLDARQAGRR